MRANEQEYEELGVSSFATKGRCVILTMHFATFIQHILEFMCMAFFSLSLSILRVYFYPATSDTDTQTPPTNTQSTHTGDYKQLHLQVQASSTIWRETSIQEAQRERNLGIWGETNRNSSSRQVKDQKQWQGLRLSPAGKEIDLTLEIQGKGRCEKANPTVF